MNAGAPVASEVQREAAAWIARLKSPDAGGRDNLELVAWLKRSPVHVHHYLELVSLDVELADPRLYEGMSLEALQLQSQGNILPLAPAPLQMQAPQKMRRSRGRRWRGIAAAAALVLAGAATVLAMLPDRYRSGIGELRSIALDDGSVVTLNTQSRIEVRYSGRERSIELIGGEALFRVAKHQSRPFRVTIEGAVVEALGTTFNIRKREKGTVVTVMEGRVAVRPPDVAGSELGAGEQIAISPAAQARRLTRSEMARVTTWTQRRLTFDQTPISEVVDELNRYNRGQLIVEDAALARRPISGAFEANDLESFVLFLEREAGVAVREGADGSRRLSAAGARD